jgi:hypothetical protein
MMRRASRAWASGSVLRAAPRLALAVAIAACAPKGPRWGESEPEPESSPAPTAAPEQSAGAICETPQFLGFELGAPRDLPKGESVQSARLIQDQPAGSAPLTIDDVRDMLDSGVPLDSCDPSVEGWQYSPGTSGTLSMRGGERLRLQLYLGGRAALIWPDGKAVMFDYGDPAPWLPKDVQPMIRRDWKRDRDCTGAQGHPHFIARTAKSGGDEQKLADGLARMCSPARPSDGSGAAGWCCP